MGNDESSLPRRLVPGIGDRHKNKGTQPARRLTGTALGPATVTDESGDGNGEPSRWHWGRCRPPKSVRGGGVRSNAANGRHFLANQLQFAVGARRCSANPIARRREGLSTATHHVGRRRSPVDHQGTGNRDVGFRSRWRRTVLPVRRSKRHARWRDRPGRQRAAARWPPSGTDFTARFAEGPIEVRGRGETSVTFDRRHGGDPRTRRPARSRPAAGAGRRGGQSKPFSRGLLPGKHGSGRGVSGHPVDGLGQSGTCSREHEESTVVVQRYPFSPGAAAGDAATLRGEWIAERVRQGGRGGEGPVARAGGGRIVDQFDGPRGVDRGGTEAADG